MGTVALQKSAFARKLWPSLRRRLFIILPEDKLKNWLFLQDKIVIYRIILHYQNNRGENW